VVTVATDGFDRYPSVLAELEERNSAPAETALQGWLETVFRNYDPQTFLDVRPREQKQRLFGYKQRVWSEFGYSQSYLDGMQSQSFWDAEFDKIGEIDRRLIAQRNA
jgi:hypothetical protein